MDINSLVWSVSRHENETVILWEGDEYKSDIINLVINGAEFCLMIHYSKDIHGYMITVSVWSEEQKEEDQSFKCEPWTLLAGQLTRQFADSNSGAVSNQLKDDVSQLIDILTSACSTAELQPLISIAIELRNKIANIGAVVIPDYYDEFNWVMPVKESGNDLEQLISSIARAVIDFFSSQGVTEFYT